MSDPAPESPFACRPGCAACCIAASISSPIPGMPNGKPAGVPCINLNEKRLCSLWGTPQYPKVCKEFTAAHWICGDTTEQALTNLRILDHVTRPGT